MCAMRLLEDLRLIKRGERGSKSVPIGIEASLEVVNGGRAQEDRESFWNSSQESAAPKYRPRVNRRNLN
jgi:hypothetical protein